MLACSGKPTTPSASLAIAGGWTYAERITDTPDQRRDPDGHLIEVGQLVGRAP